MAERQIEHRKSCFVLSPLAFPSSTVAKSAYCFKYREEPISLLRSSHPKKYLPNFLTQKYPGVENFKPKKPRHLKSGVATPLGNYLSNAWVTCGVVFHTGYPRTSKGSKHQFLCNVQDGLVDAPSFALCHRIYLPRNFSYYNVRRCRVSSRLPTQTAPNLRCIRG